MGRYGDVFELSDNSRERCGSGTQLEQDNEIGTTEAVTLSQLGNWHTLQMMMTGDWW